MAFVVRATSTLQGWEYQPCAAAGSSYPPALPQGAGRAAQNRDPEASIRLATSHPNAATAPPSAHHATSWILARSSPRSAPSSLIRSSFATNGAATVDRSPTQGSSSGVAQAPAAMACRSIPPATGSAWRWQNAPSHASLLPTGITNPACQQHQDAKPKEKGRRFQCPQPFRIQAATTPGAGLLLLSDQVQPPPPAACAV
jgi:hypothetical protein